MCVPRTKTPSGERELPLPPRLFERTIKLIEEGKALRELTGQQQQEEGLLFPNSHGGPLVPSSINHTLDDLYKKADLSPIRLNDLRHTFATLVRSELGYDQDVVGALLGHQPKNVTGHYAKVLLPLKREAIDSLENLILRRKP